MIVTPQQFYHNVRQHGYEKVLDSIPHDQIEMIVPHDFKMMVINAKQTLDGLRAASNHDWISGK